MEAERLQSLLVHLGLWHAFPYLSVSLFVFYCICYDLALKPVWSVSLWSRVGPILYCLPSSTINFCGSSAWKRAEILIPIMWNVWLWPINAFPYYGYKIIHEIRQALKEIESCNRWMYSFFQGISSSVMPGFSFKNVYVWRWCCFIEKCLNFS